VDQRILTTVMRYGKMFEKVYGNDDDEITVLKE
jgi:hypothetical protein